MLIDEFRKRFSPHLEKTIRWQAFNYLAENLLAKNGQIWIGETGSLRHLDSWATDGNSTIVWDWLCMKTGGRGFSVDIEPYASEMVQEHCKHITPFNMDSTLLLASPKVGIERLDLLYLDSYDFAPPFADSKLHHAAELAICYPRLKSGCFIAVDDCHTKDHGKHSYIKLFFEELGIKPDIESYVHVWRKP